jgi:glycosyltransferase involved in cell wall biosynthesis
MRVLFCTLDYAPSAAGGAEKQAQLQAEALVARGHTVDVVCPQAAGHRSGNVDGIRVHRLPRLHRRPFRTVSYLLALSRFLILRLHDYDLVHVHLANLHADIAVAIARTLRRPSYVKLAAGGPLGEIGRLRPIAPVTRFYGIRHATLIQAISEEIASDLRELGVSDDRIRRIPNGVAVPRLTTANRAEERSRLGLPPDSLIVLFAGRMEADKGVGDLIAVWRAWSPPPDRILVLLGSPGRKDPIDLDDLPATAEHRPWSSDVGAYLAAADIFVLPSYAEGMSNALLEAMAASVPPIASRVGATTELIQHGQNGQLIDAGDRIGLRRALETLADDAALRRRLGKAARATVLKSYGIDSVVIKIEQAYRSIASV